MKDHGFKSIRTKDPLDVMKRIWALPTFEIHGHGRRLHGARA